MTMFKCPLSDHGETVTPSAPDIYCIPMSTYQHVPDLSSVATFAELSYSKISVKTSRRKMPGWPRTPPIDIRIFFNDKKNAFL